MAPAFEKEADAPYEARVLWWNSSTVALYCPLCGEVECHDTQSGGGTFIWEQPMNLTALCRSTGVTYQAVFPWELGLGWEKNWESKRLDTVGLDLSILGIEESWQPTSMAISGPPLQAREDPLFWPARITKDHIGNSLLYPDGRHRRKAEVNEILREKRKSASPILGSEIQVPLFRPRIILGDMRLMLSERPKSNWIQILAPAATIGGNILPSPLALVKSDKLLKHKTVAVLDRRGPYEPIIAVSGWKDFPDRADNVINQEFWSREVRELVEYTGHKLDVHNLDHGIEGRASSSHAEKQLMAFFVRMHCFLDEGFEEDKMAKLNILSSHLGLREAWIGIDKPACKNCVKFKESLEAVCDVQFHFVLMKRVIRSKNDGEGIEIEKLKTPIRSKTAKFLPLTPPDSGGRFSEGRSQDYDEEDEEYLDDFEEACHTQSPCQQQNLRPLTARLNPRITKDGSCLSKPDPASFKRNLQKRPRSESGEDSYDDSEYSPPLSAARRTPSRAKRSKSLMIPASKTPFPLPTSAHTDMPTRTSQIQIDEQPQYHRYRRLSTEELMTVIDEVSISMEEKEQIEAQFVEDTSDSDIPIIPRRRRNKTATRKRIVIDLRGYTTDEDNDSEGSRFSP